MTKITRELIDLWSQLLQITTMLSKLTRELSYGSFSKTRKEIKMMLSDMEVKLGSLANRIQVLELERRNRKVA